MPSASKISVKQQIADNKTIVSQMGQKVIGLDGPNFGFICGFCGFRLKKYENRSYYLQQMIK